MDNSTLPPNELNDKIPQKELSEPINKPKRKYTKRIIKNANRNKLVNEENKELFAQALLTAPSATEAYKQVFGTTNDASATVNASKLLSTSNIKARVRELLQARRSTSLERLTERLGNHVESEDGSLSLKSIDLSMKLYGALDNDGMNHAEPADININIIANASNHNEA